MEEEFRRGLKKDRMMEKNPMPLGREEEEEEGTWERREENRGEVEIGLTR